jgi:hypothetical protein
MAGLKGITYYNLTTVLIAAVWLVNGLVCKVLNFVPRHERIVAHIFGDNNTGLLIIKIIGVCEIILSVWIVKGKWPKATAVFQIVIILTMNILELALTPDLLLWGRFNIIFALLFCTLIYFHGFRFKKEKITT